MKGTTAQNIRNFVLAGHGGAGKTSLADLMLHKAGISKRLGNVNEGTSVSDFRPEEQEKVHSIYSASLHMPWKDCHFFFCDCPGYQDFRGEPAAAIHVADMVLIVLDAVNGIEPGAINAYKKARTENRPCAFFINGLDKDQANYEKVLSDLRDSYGATRVIPFTVPVGAKSDLSGVIRVLGSDDDSVADDKTALMDTVAESDEELMMKYLEGEELSEEEVSKGLHEAVHNGDIVPVYAGSVSKDVGIEELMNGIAYVFPSPVDCPVKFADVEFEPNPKADPIAQVFKSVNDPFIGQLTFLRVYAGTFHSDTEYVNLTTGSKERFGSLLLVNGKEQSATDQAGPGEIFAVAKLKDTHISNTVGTKSESKTLPPIEYPKPTISFAVTAESKGDEDKIGTGLARLVEEDPTIVVDRNSETHQLVLSGMGDQHVNNLVHRLETNFKVKVNLSTPKVPYRETITATGSGQYRHKKQTGGHGQFAEVHLRVEPLPDEDFRFDNEVVGGNIPKNYIPAVEKGIVETLTGGPLANCKIINLKAVVYDGKFHPVDSSEMAFKIASRGALREAMKKAKPILLEPIMKLRVMFPEEYMGDISGDLNTRRGRILGMDRQEGMQVVEAEVPLAETFTYSTQLRSITQGRGSFEMDFVRYDPVPSNLSVQIQAEAQKEAEEG